MCARSASYVAGSGSAFPLASYLKRTATVQPFFRQFSKVCFHDSKKVSSSGKSSLPLIPEEKAPISMKKSTSFAVGEYTGVSPGLQTAHIVFVYPAAGLRMVPTDSVKSMPAVGTDVTSAHSAQGIFVKISAAEAANAAAEVKIFLMISSNADSITILYHLAQQQSSCFIYYDNKLKPLNTKKRLTKHKNCGKINYR